MRLIKPKQSRLSIERAVSTIQALPPYQRALLGRDSLIRSSDSKLKYGKNEARIRRFLAYSGIVGFVLLSLAFVLYRYWKGRNTRVTLQEPPLYLFVGIGTLREEKLRKNFFNEFRSVDRFIDQRFSKSFQSLNIPSFTSVIVSWRRTIKESLKVIRIAKELFDYLDILSSLTMRSYELAYLIAVFDKLSRHSNETIVAFSTADLAAHAACIAGLKCEYHQHGLLSKTLIFPNFSKMVAISQYEANYVKKKLGGINTLTVIPLEATKPLNQCLAITLDYGNREASPIIKLIRLARQYDIDTVVRPHPHGKNSLIEEIKEATDVTFDMGRSFDEFLVKWRPSFIASWYSTTLLDGLLFGALPITFSTDDPITVLPIDEISIAFPKENSLLQSCFDNPKMRTYYHKTFLDKVMQ